MAKGMKENKVVRGWSLSKENVRWVMGRALALSTPYKRVSDSLFLDNLITAKREELARAKRILKSLTPTSPQPSPKGEGAKSRAG